MVDRITPTMVNMNPDNALWSPISWPRCGLLSGVLDCSHSAIQWYRRYLRPPFQFWISGRSRLQGPALEILLDHLGVCLMASMFITWEWTATLPHCLLLLLNLHNLLFLLHISYSLLCTVTTFIFTSEWTTPWLKIEIFAWLWSQFCAI